MNFRTYAAGRGSFFPEPSVPEGADGLPVVLREVVEVERGGEALRVVQVPFGQVERGLKCPTIDTLCKVAKALEVSPAELLQTGFTGEQASLHSRRAAELLAGVPDDKLEQVLRILEDVTDLFRKPLL